MKEKMLYETDIKGLTEGNVSKCEFVKASRIKLDANKVYKEFVVINKEYGNLQDEVVWQYAKDNETSELHKGVEWDKDIASKKYQLQQIHQIIYNLRVVTITTSDKNDKPITYKVNFQPYTHLSNAKGYSSTFEIISNEDKYEQLKRDAYRDLLYWQEKYKSVLEMKDIFDAIDKLQI